jgi:hypothetical protein
MSAIKLVAGDNRPYVKLTLKNADGTVLDVSGATTVSVKLRAMGSTTVISTLTCTKPNGGADGLVQFNFPGAALVGLSGSYEGEVVVNFGSDVQTIYDTLKFVVRAHF